MRYFRQSCIIRFFPIFMVVFIANLYSAYIEFSTVKNLFSFFVDPKSLLDMRPKINSERWNVERFILNGRKKIQHSFSNANVLTFTHFWLLLFLLQSFINRCSSRYFHIEKSIIFFGIFKSNKYHEERKKWSKICRLIGELGWW